MTQFDGYQGVGRTEATVVDLQADVLDRLATHVVAPLLPRAKAEIVTGLTPVVEFGGAGFLVLTQEMAAVPKRELQHRVGSLASGQDQIKRALDILLFGF
jgi:toxin CcdB